MREMAGRMQGAGAMPAKEAGGPIDLAHLDCATFGDRALRREVLSLFERQAAKLAAELAAAADMRSRSEAAHTLRGAALGIGANAVAEAALALEGAADDPIELTGALARLAARVAEVRLAIGGLLAKE